MAVREIRLLGDPILRRECEPVGEIDDEVRRLARDLEETMYEADGVGLAAPQVGVPIRMFAYDVRDPERPAGVLIDPRVESTEGSEKGEEGCLSIPGLSALVERPARAVVTGRDPEGEEVRLEAEGLLARCLLHENDHLDGVLFLDHLSPLKRKMLLDKWSKREPGHGAGAPSSSPGSASPGAGSAGPGSPDGGASGADPSDAGVGL